MPTKFPFSPPLKSVSRSLAEKLDDKDQPVSEFIFAVTHLPDQGTQVIKLSADQNGLEDLANLIRAENVIMVICGYELSVSVDSVVTLVGAGTRYQDRLPVR